MNLIQFYETLILRDVMFYFLPGSLTLSGIGVVVWVQIPNTWQDAIAKNLPSNDWIFLFFFLALSYVLGHILYIIHNHTVGKVKTLKRANIIRKYLKSTNPKNNSVNFTQFLRKSLIDAVTDDGIANQGDRLIRRDMLEVYFTASKYIRLKSTDLYTLYISRLTATSRFYGVMSIGSMLLGISCASCLFSHMLPVVWNAIVMLVLFVLSYFFIQQSVADQHELVWNVLQTTHLLYLEEQKSQNYETERG